jgi:hypothetical protein
VAEPQDPERRRPPAAEAGVRRNGSARQPTLPRPLFTGAAIASIGGPLALIALYVPGAAGRSISAAGTTTLLAVAAFCVPLAIWLAYSEHVVSAGGLAAFVEAAAGRTAARAQAIVWTVSYFLYLPYTVTYVVYDVLPPVFPGIVPYRASLELALPVAIYAFVLAPQLFVFGALSVGAVVQLVLVVVLGAFAYVHAGASTSTFTATAGGADTGRGVGGVALLFVCVSLPLFFGAEVRGGGVAVRRGLVSAYLLVAAALVFAAVPLASVSGNLRGAELPGVAMAQAFAGRGLAVAVAVVSAASVVGLIVLEFLALGRLAAWAFGVRVRPALVAIGVPFLIADALSLLNPDRFYSELLRPSLIALWISQLVVFAVFPLLWFRRRRRLVPAGVVLAAVACALAGYGLYTAIITSSGT